MTRRSARQPTRARLALPLTMSAAMHGSLLVLLILAGRASRQALPPIYRVELIAAPAGAPAIGTVTETPPPAKAPETPPPKRAESVPKSTVPVKKPPLTRKAALAKATPVPDARSARHDEPAPKAGGGPQGGQGADVANVKTEGVEFPFPAYLQNVVRQIQLRFNPRPGAFTAEMVFLIRRDGTVTGTTFRRRSGNFSFDTEALGAVESAGSARAFGALPDGWADDVLTVIFTFSPQIIR
jgi:periplasmic protein TonB